MNKIVLTIVAMVLLGITTTASATLPVPTTQCLNESGDKHIFWFNGGHRFIKNGECKIAEDLNNGTAEIYCEMVYEQDTTKGFNLILNASGKIHAPIVPEGSPKNPYEGSDTSDWYYYENVSGALVGKGGFHGVNIMVDITGPLFQVGDGAGIHGPGLGAASWFNYEVVENLNHITLPFANTGKSDINVGFEECPAIDVCIFPTGGVETMPFNIGNTLIQRGQGSLDVTMCDNVTICHLDVTRTVDRFRLKHFPGYTVGACGTTEPPVTTTSTTTTTTTTSTTTTTEPPVVEPPVVSCNYSTQFLGKEFDNVTNTSTFTYSVCGTGKGKDLSHIVFATQHCIDNNDLVSTNPSSPVEFGVDSTTRTVGIKFDSSLDTGECRTYSFTLAGNVSVDTNSRFAIKAGRSVCKATVAGPGCATSDPLPEPDQCTCTCNH